MMLSSLQRNGRSRKIMARLAKCIEKGSAKEERAKLK
jgi:hypothetical protein